MRRRVEVDAAEITGTFAGTRPRSPSKNDVRSGSWLKRSTPAGGATKSGTCTLLSSLSPLAATVLLPLAAKSNAAAFSPALESASGHASAYWSIVKATLWWPISVCTVFAFSPAWINAVAYAWRSMWGVPVTATRFRCFPSGAVGRRAGGDKIRPNDNDRNGRLAPGRQ